METEKELDLIDLIKICWKWFILYIFNPVVFCIRFTINKWWVVLLSAIVGFVISFCISTYCPKYVGCVTYENNVGHSSDFINAVRPLSHTSAEYMSSVLDIPVDEAANIISIAPHALYYRDSLRTSFYVDVYDQAPKESSALSNRFALEILAKDLNSFTHLQDGFIKYYSNNTFYSRQAASKVKSLDSSSKLAKGEAEKLDELRVNGGSNGGVVLSRGDVYSMMDPAAISREVVRLNEISVNQANALEYGTTVVTVVSPLMIDSRPVNWFLFTYKKWMAVCIVIGIVLAFIITYRKNIKDLINGQVISL